MKLPSESLKNKVISRIIDFINLHAEGRLLIAPPTQPLPEIDLVIKKKGEYRIGEQKKDEVIIKANVFGLRKTKKFKEAWLVIFFREKKSRDEIFEKEVDLSIFRGLNNIYFIFVFFDALKQDIEDYLCVISLDQLKQKAQKFLLDNKLIFKSFISPEKKDDYSEFLIHKDNLSRYFLNIIFLNQL